MTESHETGGDTCGICAHRAAVVVAMDLDLQMAFEIRSHVEPCIAEFVEAPKRTSVRGTYLRKLLKDRRLHYQHESAKMTGQGLQSVFFGDLARTDAARTIQ